VRCRSWFRARKLCFGGLPQSNEIDSLGRPDPESDLAPHPKGIDEPGVVSCFQWLLTSYIHVIEGIAAPPRRMQFAAAAGGWVPVSP
jgi:hypothetical protein